MRSILFAIVMVIASTVYGGAQSAARQAQSPGVVILGTTLAEARSLSETNKTVDRLVQGVTVPGGKVAVAVLRRDRAETAALIHSNVTEIYLITKGTGTIVTGGTLTNPKATDLSSLWAGPSLSGVQEGGESRDVGPNDMIIVPAGTPHRFSAISGVIEYLVIRSEDAK